MSNSEILLKAYRASAILRERQKSLTKEHSERRKKLGALMEEINKVEMTAGGQRDLAGVGVSLSPELSDLLENPAHGL
jgi:hypothetical protein